MNHDHIVSHIHHGDLKSDSTLHVVGVISNPIRYHSRYRLFREWEKKMLATPNVKLHIVEAAFGDRHHEIAKGADNDLQLRITQEIWHKENMVNLGVKHLLPTDWRYMAWVDADVEFRDPSWALETLHQLQHYHVVQPWRSCADLGFWGQSMQQFESFCYVHRLGVPKQTNPSQPYKYAHSGFAWACDRYFWENTGGLMDFAILGSADHHMAFAMINEVGHSVHGKMSQDFKDRCNRWQDKAFAVTGGRLGFVNTRIEHFFHGPKKRRQYRERWQILIENDFQPTQDLMFDSQGVIKLVGKPRLLEECANYMRHRHEDSIEEY